MIDMPDSVVLALNLITTDTEYHKNWWINYNTALKCKPCEEDTRVVIDYILSRTSFGR